MGCVFTHQKQRLGSHPFCYLDFQSTTIFLLAEKPKPDSIRATTCNQLSSSGPFLTTPFLVLPSARLLSKCLCVCDCFVQVLATPIGGLIRDSFGEYGYVLLFLLAAIYFALGGGLVFFIKGAK